MSLKGVVDLIARHLVDEPDEVEVKEIEGEHNALIELRVSESDIGKVIGKDGRTAQAIRTVLSAASNKLGKRVQLDIVD